MSKKDIREWEEGERNEKGLHQGVGGVKGERNNSI